MIVDLPATSSSALNKALTDLRTSGGAVALGRVLSLVIVTDEEDCESVIKAANDASREHPCRVIVASRGSRRGLPRLDGQIRVGGDAGASDVVVMRLYGELTNHAAAVVLPLLLPDAPVVAWWPGKGPDRPADDPIGRLAQRRVTDAAAETSPLRVLAGRATTYVPGDTDLSWTRITLWRGLLAAALDQPPYERVTSATVTGNANSPSTELLAAWLTMNLRCPVRRESTRGEGIVGVTLERRSGSIDLVRPDGRVATLTQPGQPVRHVALNRRADKDCLAEELRRLDPDEVYAETLCKGLPALARAKAKRAADKAPAKPASPAGPAGRSGSDTLAARAARTAVTPASTADAVAPKARKRPARSRG